MASQILQHPFNLASQGCNKTVKWEEGKEGRVRGGSQGGLEGLGAGWRVSGHRWLQWFGSLLGNFLKADTHNKYALVFSHLLCSDYYLSLWLKRTGSEDSVSQPGLGKQVRDHQHSSEVFSFLFTEEIYIGHKKKKKHGSKSRSDNTKIKEIKTGSPSSIEWICHFWYIFWETTQSLEVALSW